MTDAGFATRTAETRHLVEQYYAAANAHDVDAVLATLHPDCTHYSRLSEYPRAGVAFAFDVTFAAFPDMRWTVRRMIVEDDWAAALVFIEGTHSGPYLGKDATGKRIGVHSVDVARVEDGLFMEHRGVLDELHLIAQIGVVPETYLAQMS